MSYKFLHLSFRLNCICKQCRCRSHCSKRSSLIRVYTVCHSTKYFKKQLHKKQNKCSKVFKVFGLNVFDNVHFFHKKNLCCWYLMEFFSSDSSIEYCVPGADMILLRKRKNKNIYMDTLSNQEIWLYSEKKMTRKISMFSFSQSLL